MNKVALLESILFTANEPVLMNDLEKYLKMNREGVESLLNKLRERYASPDSGIKLYDSEGFRLVVKGEYLDRVSHLTPHADLSRGLLRVLSIIAYHEPINQSDIVKVVGNRTYEYVKNLDARGLIKGERKGRTKILKTTPHFEEYFGAKKDEIKKMVEKNEKLD